MRPLASFVLAATACLAGTAADAQSRGRETRLGAYANPGAVIAAEIAFNQLAQEKGQWTAFRQTAADDAVMFVPERAKARDWLKARADPPVSVKWQPYAVWTSCDGTYAVTRGAWQRPNATGFFTTVWQRQPKTGAYKWVLDLGGPLAAPLAPPEMIAGKVATCRARPPGSGPDEDRRPRKEKLEPIDPVAAQSRDGTLRWKAVLDASGAGSFTLESWDGSAYRQVLHADIPPQG